MFESALAFPLLGGLPTGILFAALSAMMFAGNAMSLMNAPTLDCTTLSPNQCVGAKAQRWRNERNFWIAALALVSWLVCLKLVQLHKTIAGLKAEVTRLRPL